AARLRAAGPALAEKVRQVFARRAPLPPGDVDGSLYDGFVADADRRRIAEVRATPPEALAAREFGFEDPRLPELLLRYRARNWPDLLDAGERAHWDAYRRRRLAAASGLSEVSLPGFFSELETLRLAHAGDGRRLALLDRLEAWGRELQADLCDAAPAAGPDPAAVSQ
ncbi:MAG: exodeoxyribonuclease I, partial [Gammaproteobacteria bacterium]|nr:exodeoxyribonuclease I [Gammaproteobacteria bacterium]